MTIDIRHTHVFPDIQNLSKSLEIFTNKLESIAQSFNSNQSQTNTNTTKSTSSNNANQEDLNKSFNNNTKKIEELIASFNTSAVDNKFKLQIDRELNKNLQDLSKKIEIASGGNNSSSNFQNNLMKGILGIGLATAAANIGKDFANRGSIIGSAQQSLNTNITSSSDFIQNYQSQMMSNTQGMKNTIASLVGGAIGGLLTVGNPYGIAAGTTAGGSLYGYLGNKSNQQDISNSQFMLQKDQEAWRVQNIVGAEVTGQFRGNQLGFNANGKHYNSTMSTLQAQMYNTKELSPYASFANTYQLEGNRQQIRNEGVNGRRVKNVVNAGMAMGVSEQNMPNFINVVTTAAQATGNDTNKILNTLLEVTTKNGGDAIKITAQTLQLMQTSHIANTFGQAAELIGRFQYNPAAMQNKINASNTSPMNKFIASAYGKMLGLSPQEISSGQLNPMHKEEYRKAQSLPSGTANPRFLLMEMFSGFRGQNINVNNDFGVLPKNQLKGQQVEGITPSASMNAMGDFISEAIKNLKVDTQVVTANTVNIMGNINGGMVATNTYSHNQNNLASYKLNNTAGNGTTLDVPPLYVVHHKK